MLWTTNCAIRAVRLYVDSNILLRSLPIKMLGRNDVTGLIWFVIGLGMFKTLLKLYKDARKRSLQILTLASRTQFDRGRYVLSFDVIKVGDYDKIKELRRQEVQVYEELECITTPCSSAIEMSLTSDKCQFTFTVSGALKPASQFEQGENVLEYNEFLPESRKFLSLVPNDEYPNEGVTTIKFCVGEQVMHTVTIHNGSVEPLVRMCSGSMHSLNGSVVTDFDQTAMKRLDQGGLHDTAFGQPMTRDMYMASPLPSRPQGPTPVSVESNDSWGGDEISGHRVGNQGGARLNPQGGVGSPPRVTGDDGATSGTTADDNDNQSAYAKILTDPSLRCLVSQMSPQDVDTLLTHLGVPHAIIAQKKKDHPDHIVSALFHCLIYWRAQNHDACKCLYDQLLKQIEAIGRKDIKMILEKCLRANKGLENDDFKR